MDFSSRNTNGGNHSDFNHHVRQNYCRTRLKYRQGKNLTAVKVYTVANESPHLLIFGVPKINLSREIKKSFTKFGPLKSVLVHTNKFLEEHPNYKIEPFTDIFLVTFEKLHNARLAKKFLDANNFYGGILHISYAPEYETLEEIEKKLEQRKKEVNFRFKMNLENTHTGKRKMSSEGNIDKTTKRTDKRMKY